MSKGGDALKGAGAGAATGAALGSVVPGIGTAIGAGAGALIGGIGGWLKSSGSGDKAAPSYNPNRNDFSYGLGPAGGFAEKEAERYRQRQFQLEALGEGAQSRQGATQAMPDSIQQVQSGGQGYLQGADAAARQQQLQALGGIQQQTGALNQFANREQGPSAAQAQLQAGTDMAAKQQYGMARAQPGGGGAALRNASFNAAGISGNAANSAAMLRAQEDQSYRNQQLQALGAAQQGAGMSAGYAGQLRQGDQGFAQAQAGQANYDANAANQFNQGQQQLQYQVGSNNLQAGLQTQQQNDAMTLGTGAQSMGYDALRAGAASAATGQNNAYEAAVAQGAGLGSANYNAAQANSTAQTGMYLGAATGALGAYAQMQGGGTKSDVRAKKDIIPVSMSHRDFPDAPSGDGMPSPEAHARQQQLEALGAMGDFRAPDLRPAQGYEYSYKNPAADGAGRYVGPMAQDLEHLPGVVEQAPDGQKAINAPRLTLANTAALSEVQRKQDELERALRLQALGGGGAPSGFVRPDVKQPDYEAYGPAGYHY
jgi:hypothetical protein